MHYLKIFVFAILVIFLSSCKKDVDVNGKSNEQTTNGGLARPVGQPMDDKEEMTIGAQGGTIVSVDVRIKVEIPAGALSADVAIGVQPITRTLVDGAGDAGKMAFRLTPHGQVFTKPVKISFQYTDADLTGLNPELLGIAYQDKAGKWKGVGGVEVDKAAKTISTHVNHFSDWSIYEAILLMPGIDFSLEKSKSAILRVMNVTVLPSLIEDGEDAFLDDTTEAKLSVDWRIVNGGNSGTIVPVPTRPVAIYTAPGAIPAQNPVTIEAKVYLNKEKTKYILLVRNITILDSIKPGIHFSINGGNWVHVNNTTEFNSGESRITTNGDFPFNISFDLVIKGGNATNTGKWSWNWSNTTFVFGDYRTSNFIDYSHIFSPPPPAESVPSPGYVTIAEIKKDEFGVKWATGEFIVEKATGFKTSSVIGQTALIKGYFHLSIE